MHVQIECIGIFKVLFCLDSIRAIVVLFSVGGCNVFRTLFLSCIGFFSINEILWFFYQKKKKSITRLLRFLGLYNYERYLYIVSN